MNTTKTIGRYEIIEELGRGAMGSVFKARDPAVGRTVALKTILAAALGGEQTEQYRTRFLREAHAAGSLAHPGIVPVFDVGEHEGAPFLVMEFVDGRTLAEALKKGERFTLERVCEIGAQIAEALGYAHRQGVVHRDIKPANILMTSRAVYGAERPRITDFGIAKLTTSEITTTGQLLGTPSFMPPEQFTGAPIDGRADLFSLGVILYSMATGEQPFQGETMTAVSYKIVHTLPVPPSKLNPAIPPMLEGVILKCLAKSPADRYQTGEELAQELAAARARSGESMPGAAPLPQAALLGSDDAHAPAARSFPPRHGSPAANGAPAPASAVGAARRYAAIAAAKLSATLETKRWSTIALTAVALVAVALMVRTWREAHSAAHETALAKPSPPTGVKIAKPAPGVIAGRQPVTASPGAANLIAAPPAPMPATPAFNPKRLDPKTSAKLRVDLKHVPDGLGFTIVMNGRPYLHTVAGNKESLENLFVPPGIQQFSVVYVSAGQQKSTNFDSDEFKAKKRRTLHIELKGHTKDPAVAQGGLTGNAQLFVSLK